MPLQNRGRFDLAHAHFDFGECRRQRRFRDGDGAAQRSNFVSVLVHAQLRQRLTGVDDARARRRRADGLAFKKAHAQTLDTDGRAVTANARQCVAKRARVIFRIGIGDDVRENRMALEERNLQRRDDGKRRLVERVESDDGPLEDVMY